MFLDDLIEDFYEEPGGKYRRATIPGQICFTQIPYTHENRQIWRPSHYDVAETMATTFQIVAAGQDAYRRPTPLADPRLETNEEFPVVRAKKRPVVLIRPAPATVPAELLRRGHKPIQPLAVVVPCYSVVEKTRRSNYPSEFIERVRRLEFPELFFLPSNPGVLNNDSLLQINRMTNVYQSSFEPANRKLTETVLRILQGQVHYYLTGEYAGDYQTAREMLLNP